MDDTAYQRYFTQPTQTYHRRNEALRAVIIDGRAQKEVADEFGFQYSSLRPRRNGIEDGLGTQDRRPIPWLNRFRLEFDYR